jgi:hypothetical protein
MTMTDAQADMRQAYVWGAPGVFASGIAWLVAGIVALTVSPRTAVITLFFGGMLIHPASMLIAKLLGRSGKHRAGNPLAPLALEGTIWMLLAIPIALYLSLEHSQYFFIAMLLTIGGRYLTFATLYGTRLYWLLGALLAAAAFALIALKASTALAAFTGSSIELVFAFLLFRISRREPGTPPDRAPRPAAVSEIGVRKLGSGPN